jgi:CubicO group peptidase (beta-lactamase class C family)
MKNIKAILLALTRNGEVVYAKGYGEARPGLAASGDTPFSLGSVSKSMTALGRESEREPSPRT